MKKRFLECGKIVATHGLRGEVKVLPWCDGPEALVPIKTFYLDGGNTPKGRSGAGSRRTWSF